MFKDMKLGTKLLLSFLAVGVIPFAVIGITSLMNSSEALEKQAFNQLKAQREIKKDEIETFFHGSRSDMGVMLETVAKVQDGAFEKLESIQELKSAQLEQYLDKVKNDITVLAKSQDVQIAFNQLKNYHDYMGFGADAAYDVSTDQYQGIWKSFEQSLGKYITEFGYYDLFIICKPHGHVMYTYAQEPDLGANLGSGQYQDEGLARLWRKVVDQDRIVVEDFSEYAPSQGRQAMFIGGPVTNDQNETIGVVALQVPSSKIQAIVQQRQGLGSTGETYLAARQESRIEFRSDLQTMGEGQYVTGYDLTDIAPEYLVQTLDGNPVHDVFLDSAGNPVIVAGDLLEVGEGLEWGMVTKINLEEALTGGAQDGEKDYFAEYIEALRSVSDQQQRLCLLHRDQGGGLPDEYGGWEVCGLRPGQADPQGHPDQGVPHRGFRALRPERKCAVRLHGRASHGSRRSGDCGRPAALPGVHQPHHAAAGRYG